MQRCTSWGAEKWISAKLLRITGPPTIEPYLPNVSRSSRCVVLSVARLPMNRVQLAGWGTGPAPDGDPNPPGSGRADAGSDCLHWSVATAARSGRLATGSAFTAPLPLASLGLAWAVAGPGRADSDPACSLLISLVCASAPALEDVRRRPGSAWEGRDRARAGAVSSESESLDHCCCLTAESGGVRAWDGRCEGEGEGAGRCFRCFRYGGVCPEAMSEEHPWQYHDDPSADGWLMPMQAG